MNKLKKFFTEYFGYDADEDYLSKATDIINLEYRFKQLEYKADKRRKGEWHAY